MSSPRVTAMVLAMVAAVAAVVAVIVTVVLVGGTDCAAQEAQAEVQDQVEVQWEGASIVSFAGDHTPEELVDPELDQLAEAVVRLQPSRFSEGDPRARELAGMIRDAAHRFHQDPYVALAIARRESDFDPQVGTGEIVGGLGERGYFQIYPDGAAEKLCGGCDQTDPECNAHTAMCWLSIRREECGSSPWVYVAAYGRRKCPKKWEARGWREVRRARMFYCLAKGPGCEEAWPLR